MLPEFLIHLSFPSLITTRVHELIQMRQEREEMQQNEDPYYNYFVNASATAGGKGNAMGNSESPNRRQNPQQSVGSPSLVPPAAAFFSKDINERASQVPSQFHYSNVLSQNYFDFVERLQNDQFQPSTSTVRSAEDHQDPRQQRQDSEGSPQRNVAIKQTALLNIENAVNDCRVANQSLFKSTARQLARSLSRPKPE